MKLINLIQAKPALEDLTEKRFTNFKIARKLVALRKQVAAEAEFYEAEQKKIVQAYAEFNPDGSLVFLDERHIKLKTPEAKMAFDNEIQKLLETEIDGIEPVVLGESDFSKPDDIPSPSDMIALEGLVEFAD